MILSVDAKQGADEMSLINFSSRTISRLAVIVCVCGFAMGTMFYSRSANAGFGVAAPEPSATPRKRKAAAKPSEPAVRPNPDFPHSAKAHQIACSNCHKFPSSNWNKVRPEGEAFQDISDYPKHDSCVGCHKQMFFKGRPPVVCSICHTNPGPRDSSRHPFPNPRELFDKSPKGQKASDSDFAIHFSHDKHVEIVTGVTDPSYKPAKGEESCSACHRTYQPAGSSPDEYVTKPPANIGD